MKSNPKESSKGTLGVFPLTKESFPTIPIPTNKKKRESAEEFRSSINTARTTACSPRVLSVPCHPTILVWNKTHPMSDVSYNSPTKRKWWGLLGRMIVMKSLQVTFKQAEQIIQKKTTNVEEKSTSPNIEKKIKSFSKKGDLWMNPRLQFSSSGCQNVGFLCVPQREKRSGWGLYFQGSHSLLVCKGPFSKTCQDEVSHCEPGFRAGFPQSILVQLSDCFVFTTELAKVQLLEGHQQKRASLATSAVWDVRTWYVL